MERKKILTKHICLTLAMLTLFAQKVSAQDTVKRKYEPYYSEIDHNLLMNKARLLCISKSGLNDVDTTIHYLLAQECQLIHTSDKFYDIFVVKSNQFLSTQVKTKKGMSTHFCGEDFENNLDCSYVLVFSYHTYRFYLLSGFSESEINAIDKEMVKYHAYIYDIFNEELVKRLPVNFDCLITKYLNKEDKDKELKCYKECGKCSEMTEVH